jgi:hypothetical protein
VDNLLQSLRRYYKEVKTNWQLNLEVPAGFCHPSTLQQNFLAFTPPRKSTSTTDVLPFDILDDHLLPDSMNNNDSTSTPVHSKKSYDGIFLTTASTTNPVSESIHIPILRSVDKPSSSLPKTISISEDSLCASVGFCRVDMLKQHLHELYLDTIKLDNTPADAVLDPGDVATMQKKARNTDPVPRSSHFGDVMHMDIVFGPEISIGNIHYGLLFTDRFSRMTYIYPLHNFTSDIKQQM